MCVFLGISAASQLHGREEGGALWHSSVGNQGRGAEAGGASNKHSGKTEKSANDVAVDITRTGIRIRISLR